jgi:hypothetical protein
LPFILQGTVDPLSVNASAGKIAAAPSQAVPPAPAAAVPPSSSAGAGITTAGTVEKTGPAGGLLPVRQFETYVELSDDSDDGDDGEVSGRARRAAAAGPRGGSEVGDGDDVFFDADEGLGVGLGVAGSTDDVEEEDRAEEEDDEEGTDWRQSIAQPSSAASSPLGASLARALHFEAPHSNNNNTTNTPPPPLPRGGSRPGPASPFLRTVTRREGAAARGSAADEEHLRRASRRLRGKAELPDLVVAVVEVRFLS